MFSAGGRRTGRSGNGDLRVFAQIGIHRVRDKLCANGRDAREEDQGSADNLDQSHALRREAVRPRPTFRNSRRSGSNSAAKKTAWMSKSGQTVTLSRSIAPVGSSTVMVTLPLKRAR